MKRPRAKPRPLAGPVHDIATETGGRKWVETVHRTGIWAVHHATTWGYSVTHLPTGLQVTEALRGDAVRLADELAEKFPTWGAELPWNASIGPEYPGAEEVKKLVQREGR